MTTPPAACSLSTLLAHAAVKRRQVRASRSKLKGLHPDGIAKVVRFDSRRRAVALEGHVPKGRRDMSAADDTVRVGLIGYGYVAKTFHAPMITATPGLQLAAVASSRAADVHADHPGVHVVDAD